MRKGNTYYGWLQDSIWDLARANWEVFRWFPYCLVSCIDSTDDLKSTTTASKIVEWEDSCDFLGRSLIVGGYKILGVAQDYCLFSNFDEIWFYEHPPTVELTLEVGIVSPLDLNVERPSKELLKWFETSGCVLGLGDGMGMNYMTTRKEVVDSLETRQRQFDSEG